MREIITNSACETLDFASELGRGLARGSVVALTGDLGTGKTIFAKGIALGMGISEDVTSPTFNLLNVYPNEIPLYHFDLYRIDRAEEFDGLCFEEYWNGDGVSVIEWAEKVRGRLPGGTLWVTLEYLDETKRRVLLEPAAH